MADYTDRIYKVLKNAKRTPLAMKKILFEAKIPKELQKKAEEYLTTLKKRGEIIEHNKKFVLSSNLGLIPAVVDSVRGAFGFAKEIGGERRFFIPGKMMLGAMPGDVVVIKPIVSSGDSPEGKIVSIADATDNPFSATAYVRGKMIEVVFDNLLKFSFPAQNKSGYKVLDGDKVMAKIAIRSDSHFGHKAEIVKVFGSSDSAEVCAEAILEENNISAEFSTEVLKEAKSVSGEIHPKEILARLDLRKEKIFTIDSADSKDLDDAVSVKKVIDGWVLGVHIADVSFYVRPKSPLDNSAYERGTSIYYANKVVPMLPKELSNGICSLNPDEDRLTLSAIINLDRGGNVKSYRFAKSVIRSAVKGVYSEINSILDGSADAKTKAKYKHVSHQIKLMNELSDILIKRRKERGCPEISSTESRFVIRDGVIEEILPRVQGKSERMIEEFMLMANQAAASFAIKNGIPFIYRIHEHPATEKIGTFAEVVKKLGFDSKGILENATPKKFSEILDAVNGTRYEKIINNLMLRSMAKAKYSEKNKGHFGLSMENYSHFTSPIRRYPDLAIHRIITSVLDGATEKNLVKRYEAFVKNAAAQSSFAEERAVRIERDCEDRYKAEFMSSRVGERFSGIISAVTAHGIYVELPNTVEGMIKIEDLPMGEYTLEDFIALKDSYSSKSYRIGDEITVEVAGANVSQGTIDFIPVNF